MAFDAEFWDERYGAEKLVYGDKPNDFLAEQVGALTNGKCLCLAEGQGRNAIWLARQGFDVTAVDQSSVGMARAAKQAEDEGVSLSVQVANLADYDLGEQRWDAIIAIFAHLPQPLRRHVHEAVVRALKPGGTFLLEAYTPRQLEMGGTGGPPNIELLMSEVDLRDELAGLDIVIGREIDREINESEMHHGMSAVVQILARKPKGE